MEVLLITILHLYNPTSMREKKKKKQLKRLQLGRQNYNNENMNKDLKHKLSSLKTNRT